MQCEAVGWAWAGLDGIEHGSRQGEQVEITPVFCFLFSLLCLQTPDRRLARSPDDQIRVVHRLDCHIIQIQHDPRRIKQVGDDKSRKDCPDAQHDSLLDEPVG